MVTINDILKWISCLLGKIIPPISCKVIYFSFDDHRNTSLITAYLIRYYLTLDIVNTSNRDVYINEMKLTINNGSTYKAYLHKTIHLLSHQPIQENIIFPIEDNSEIREGSFRLEIVPTIGRQLTINGQFPIKNNSAY